MRQMKVLGMLLVLGGLTSLIMSCSSQHPSSSSASSKEPSTSGVLRATLDPTKAEEVALKDISEGKCQLYAVEAWGWHTPGNASIKSSESAESASSDRTEYRIILITDSSTGADGVYPDAEKFAETYNQTALKYCGPQK